MELRHLRYFIAAAEDLNFTRAARRLGIAQPPLTRQIQDLEREIGAPLFDRDSRRVFLTDAGRVFLEGARNVVAQSEQAIESARRAHHGKTGRIRVGIAWGLGDTVSRVVAEYSKRYREVEIEFRNVSSGEQNEALRLRNIDVGFLRPPVDRVHADSWPLFREKFLVVVAESNPLAKSRSLKLKQLANEPLLLIPRSVSSWVFDKTLDLYQQAGLRPHTVQTETLPYEESGAILVASGRGVYIAVGSNPVHSSFRNRIRAIPLDEPGAHVEVHVGWRRHESSVVVLSFLKTVEAMFVKGARRKGKLAPPESNS